MVAVCGGGGGGNDSVNGDAIAYAVLPLKLYLKPLERHLIREGLFQFMRKLTHIYDCLRLFNGYFCLKTLPRKTNNQK